jgi:hypothetical protein
MTSIEWNDSEPGFPDFLPPITRKPALSREDAELRMKGVLEAAGIIASIYGTVLISFPDGVVYGPGEFTVNAEGYQRLR